MTDEESEEIRKRMISEGVGYIACAGYMVIVRGPTLQEYEGRMLNAHPGPLPESADTYGLGTSETILQLGLPRSKHTVHMVSAEVDAGQIVSEQEVPILPNDTAEDLFARVRETERTHFPRAMGAWLAQEVALRSGTHPG